MINLLFILEEQNLEVEIYTFILYSYDNIILNKTNCSYKLI